MEKVEFEKIKLRRVKNQSMVAQGRVYRKDRDGSIGADRDSYAYAKPDAQIPAALWEVGSQQRLCLFSQFRDTHCCLAI